MSVVDGLDSNGVDKSDISTSFGEPNPFNRFGDGERAGCDPSVWPGSGSEAGRFLPDESPGDGSTTLAGVSSEIGAWFDGRTMLFITQSDFPSARYAGCRPFFAAGTSRVLPLLSLAPLPRWQ